VLVLRLYVLPTAIFYTVATNSHSHNSPPDPSRAFSWLASSSGTSLFPRHRPNLTALLGQTACPLLKTSLHSPTSVQLSPKHSVGVPSRCWAALLTLLPPMIHIGACSFPRGAPSLHPCGAVSCPLWGLGRCQGREALIGGH
jgi:hypothetical protein